MSALVTIVDLDRTVTSQGTYSPFLLFAASRRAPWRLALVPLVVACMAAHKLGLVTRDRLKETMHRLMLGPSLPAPALRSLAETYADRVVERGLRPGARGLIARERAEGRIVILATAAHRFYAEPIAARLGVTEVVATESFEGPRGISHRLAGRNCYGSAKAAAVDARLARLGLDRASTRLRCYSDDHSDLPTFEACHERFAVNPSPKLRRHASAHGWTVVSLG